MKNVFDKNDTIKIINRIERLDRNSRPLWGKMKVAQMLAHCCVAYEFVYTDKHQKPNAFTKFLLKLFVKDTVVGEKPYQKNGRTAPAFLIREERDFDIEKKRLVDYIVKTQELGETYFKNRVSHSFGVLTIDEWNIMFYKHLDHHLTQFGV